jgi:hypothetical protein
MGAFKNDTQRGGPRGFGKQGMADDSGDDYLELKRDDAPQTSGKVFANKIQRSGVGPYADGMDKDPLTKPGSKTQLTQGDY